MASSGRGAKLCGLETYTYDYSCSCFKKSLFVAMFESYRLFLFISFRSNAKRECQQSLSVKSLILALASS